MMEIFHIAKTAIVIILIGMAIAGIAVFAYGMATAISEEELLGSDRNSKETETSENDAPQEKGGEE